MDSYHSVPLLIGSNPSSSIPCEESAAVPALHRSSVWGISMVFSVVHSLWTSHGDAILRANRGYRSSGCLE